MQTVRGPAGARLWGWASEAIEIERLIEAIRAWAAVNDLVYQASGDAAMLGQVAAPPYTLSFHHVSEPAPTLCATMLPAEPEHRDTLDAVSCRLGGLDMALPYAYCFETTVFFCQDSPRLQDVEEVLDDDMLAHTLIRGGRAHLITVDQSRRARYIFYPQARRLSEALIDELLMGVVQIEASARALDEVAELYKGVDRRLTRAMTEMVGLGRRLSGAADASPAIIQRLGGAHAQLLLLYESWQHHHGRLLALEADLTLLEASWQPETVGGARGVVQLVRDPLDRLLSGDLRREEMLGRLRELLVDTRAQSKLHIEYERHRTFQRLGAFVLIALLAISMYLVLWST